MSVAELGALQQAEACKKASAKETQAQVLAELASTATLFHATDGEAFAAITIDGHVETWPVRAPSFRRWLCHQYYQSNGKPPGSQPLKDTLDLLGARAQFDGEARAVFIRVAGVADRVYLDLADPDWRYVEVTTGGWSVAGDAGVHFVRSRGMTSIPLPTQGGNIRELQQFINVPADADFMLVVAWLLAALRPKGPYPILVLLGEQGSAKSTAARFVRSLVDPATSPIRSAPRNEHDLMIAARNGWVLAFDNLSNVPDWLSDAMCRLATGGGFSTRQLFTDADETILDAQRPLILNGIDELTRRQDLLDRSIIVQLPPIPETQRRVESDLWAEFEAARPRILGALLDAVSTGLRRIDEVKLESLPRMADFAKWAAATEPALPWREGSLLAAYANNRSESIGVALESDVIGQATLALLSGDKTSWEGTSTELLVELEGRSTERTVRSRAWPKSARALSSRLRRAATFLRTVGVEIEFTREAGGGSRRVVTIRKVPGFCVATVAPGTTEAQAIEESDTSAATQSATQNPIATQDATQTTIGKAPEYGHCDASDGCDAKSRAISESPADGGFSHVDERMTAVGGTGEPLPRKAENREVFEL